jgi:hypothetical protein
VEYPDVALPIGGDAADLADDPVVRQPLWPGRIDRKGRDLAGLCRARQRADQDGGEEKCGNGEARDNWPRWCIGVMNILP